MIKYLKGDATDPRLVDPDKKVALVHCCNDVGGWGAGFVLALSAKWPEPEATYRKFAERSKSCCGGRLPLGEIQIVPVADSKGRSIEVVNLIGQSGVGLDSLGRPPIRYDAINKGLWYISLTLPSEEYEIHLPKMGAGLAGGDWTIIERLLMLQLGEKGYTICVYTF